MAAIFVCGSRAADVTLFSDDFSNGLGQWTGKNGGAHSGVIVPDPLNTGRGGVLTFTALTGSGDIFTGSTISSTQPVIIRFDYLGLAKPGSVSGNFGGALSIAYNGSLSGEPFDTLAASGNSSGFHLIDDGQWHAVQVSRTASGPSRFWIEDWFGAGGVAGDVYFDNLQITTTVPEPSIVACGALGLACLWLYSYQSKRRTLVDSATLKL